MLPSTRPIQGPILSRNQSASILVVLFCKGFFLTYENLQTKGSISVCVLHTLLHTHSHEILKLTVKFLNFRTPENFAVIYLKFKQRGQRLGYFIKMMQME